MLAYVVLPLKINIALGGYNHWLISLAPQGKTSDSEVKSDQRTQGKTSDSEVKSDQQSLIKSTTCGSANTHQTPQTTNATRVLFLIPVLW